MTNFLADLAAVAVVTAAFFAAVILARHPIQWLIDHAPAPVHHAADWLGMCEEHP